MGECSDKKGVHTRVNLAVEGLAKFNEQARTRLCVARGHFGRVFCGDPTVEHLSETWLACEVRICTLCGDVDLSGMRIENCSELSFGSRSSKTKKGLLPDSATDVISKSSTSLGYVTLVVCEEDCAPYEQQ